MAKFEVFMKNTVWYVVTSQLYDSVLLVAAFVKVLLNINPPLPVHSL
jgi:hypothetical protein